MEDHWQGGLEARRLQYVGLGKFLDVVDGFLRTSNTQLCDELNMIEHTWTTDCWEERCDLVRPLGLLGVAWGGLRGLWVSLTASSEGLGSPLPPPPALE